MNLLDFSVDLDDVDGVEPKSKVPSAIDGPALLLKKKLLLKTELLFDRKSIL